MVDDEVEEFELIRSQPAAVQEFGEGALGGLPVEPDERADERGSPPSACSAPSACLVNAGLKENTFKLL